MNRTQRRQFERNARRFGKLNHGDVDVAGNGRNPPVIGLPLKLVIRKTAERVGIYNGGRYYVNPNTGKRMSRGPRIVKVTKTEELVRYVTGPIRNKVRLDTALSMV